MDTKRQISLFVDQLNSPESGVFPVKLEKLETLAEIGQINQTALEVSDDLRGLNAELVNFAENFVSDGFSALKESWGL